MNSDTTQNASFTDTARDVAGGLKENATDAARRAKQSVEEMAEDKKTAAADHIGRYGEAIRQSARTIAEQDPNIAWLTNQAADKIEGVADYLREKEFAELRDDAESFARRHPAAVLGGLFVAGLLLGNLAKAHRPADAGGYPA